MSDTAINILTLNTNINQPSTSNNKNKKDIDNSISDIEGDMKYIINSDFVNHVAMNLNKSSKD